MLVYGDVEWLEPPGPVIKRIERAMLACANAPPGRQRHELLVQTFIETAEFVQGLADREFDLNGGDDVSLVQTAAAKLLLAQAEAILASWQGHFHGEVSFAADTSSLRDNVNCIQPLRMKQAEGYAFYAVYPESYLLAAMQSRLPSETVVIGIRSIGLSLAALVAAGLGASPAFSLRPIGHPFRRQVNIKAALADKILARTQVDFAIVDEGPGLSGSSFASVANWLEINGVAPSRLHFFPSHGGGPGARASSLQRRRWQERPKHVVPISDVIVNAPPAALSLQNWVGELVGRPIETFRDISGGNWRGLAGDRSENWPPSHRQMEKLKFVATAGDQSWHVKFAGLGRSIAQKVRRGTVLHEAGFAPCVIGSCHGFLIEEWIKGLPIAAAAMNRQEILAAIGRYLSFRARRLPALHGGASFLTLCRMATTNIKEVAGFEDAARLGQIMQEKSSSLRHLPAVDTDNRLHKWEWLVTDDGRIQKTDALDHNSAHDLIGCQPIAWDLAGACVEFDLSPTERDELVDIVAKDGEVGLDDDVLVFFEAAYLGFQVGLWSLALATDDGQEKERIAIALHRYRRRLQPLLEC
ncbi:hypothetical protein ATY81_16890 [Rhizobium sp. R72]|uniref:hypothetical protein n=1 Tax=unclassified Rhizobium TaxID=2613769 RepID=UPI000B52A6AD|nr:MULTISPECIES: hypothetical protein [unclassified Rhizobium]OWV92852.1 hypothetical protein ATY81_16890 [Rhizobium sp. R72]OWV93063.1 hypothetical protein ATY80_16890 [Rhizobium sp. R711]